jgi:transketolase
VRNAFAQEITALSQDDPRIVLLSGDIGNRLFDSFKAAFSDRFFNCGVAEANMTGMAAGMAMSGLRPVTYTIAPFNTTRCLEQIKLDICYHNLAVVIVGVGAGLAYAGLGSTHHSFEDLAILRVLPNMTVICPGDAVEVRLALRAALARPGPSYIRLGKKNEPVVHREEPAFAIGRGIVLRKGRDACLLSTGNTLPLALAAADLLESGGVTIQVVSMHTVKPLDTDLLMEVFAAFRVVATIEEHSLIGGFASAVTEWLGGRNTGAKLLRFGIGDQFLHGSGNQNHARAMSGLTPDNLAHNIAAALEGSA